MKCDYFNECGGCSLGHYIYDEQLKYKVDIQKENFKHLYSNEFDIVKSDDGAFRNRSEFRIWKTFFKNDENKNDENDDYILDYAMTSKEKTILQIKSCSIVSNTIQELMPKLLEELQKENVLNFKLFSCEFLSSSTNDILVTLIYHKKLDELWIKKARLLEEKFQIKIIGRSRKQKVILSDDFINEKLNINGNDFYFQYKEGGFTQPNQNVNTQMIQWVINNIKKSEDLCELYCGGGNFTIPLSKHFNKVLATEISKTSIKSAKANCNLNDINNIKFIRMSSEEFVQAKEKQRVFKRMMQEDVNIDDYNFSTIFVDPPRAGLDETTIELVKSFNQIIYISCNPDTLKRDLEQLISKYSIIKFAFFDQFAYSDHIECGVILHKL